MLYILSLSKLGDKVAENISGKLGGRIITKETIVRDGLSNVAREAMENARGIIFISSTGIALRAIAPYLKGKTVDPGVVVVDAVGKFSISLLSGHLGGGNELALKVSEVINATPVITTATDALGVKAPDIIAKENYLLINDMKKAKEISSLLTEGEKIGFVDTLGKIEIPEGYVEEDIEAKAKVVVTNKILNEDALVLIRKNIILGIGCKKDTSTDKLRAFIKEALIEHGYLLKAVDKISTVDLKSEEKAILNLAKELEVPIDIHGRESIENVEHLFKGSEFVKKSIGVSSVAEPCVYLSGGEILVNRIAKEGMTLCIGERIE
ncbi:cobalt-precorrin 5A hydrolase [Clostridium sp. 'White wine YQ']|uniref:cobalt-precorrin 5A hydrolase n=1 Tax=Clostridium sp. 'White wine YQ' TaxID=3027474 RepID=UPI002365BBB8|nr:cobalt-precorrin 5A hydrolase [Clostridium sp. 'White wine YQ']MDD7795231.1 cobalt-precorrin 5A hydrolase [Clostridium sp. 'White wine YQ']